MANSFNKSEQLIKKEFELLNQLKPMPKIHDYYDLCSLYPTATCGINFQRNRYKDVLPEERSRVRLQYFQEDDSDYINANMISVHKEKYISCQAPLPSTSSHFWSMIWEQETPVIVMLTRTVEGERKKADAYWPLVEDDSIEYGPFIVTLKSTAKLAYITVRTLSVKCTKSEEERELVHLHYTEWPDFGVPETTHKIRELIRLMSYFKERAYCKGLSGPIAAHCSAGIGRCGTFLGILISLEKLVEGEAFEKLDIVDIVCKMRAQRCGMVQTDSQYQFIYRVLDDILKEKQLKQIKNSSKRLSLCLSLDDLPLSSERESNECSDRRTCSFSLSTDLSHMSSKRVSQEIPCKP